MNFDLLHAIAEKVGTPFWLYDAGLIRQRIADVRYITGTEGVQARFAMKACPAARMLEEMRAAGIWIDAVSGNEALRAMRAGFPAGSRPPQILFTADVFRDNALAVAMEHGLLVNAGSPGMLRDLQAAGYRGELSLRVNPGFGHGHVNACDTGGPSSKHGIWHADIASTAREAEAAGMQVAMLHAHIGSGPRMAELQENLARLASEFSKLLPHFPDVQAVSLGGGIPHDYRDPSAAAPLDDLRALFARCRAQLCEAAGRPLRLEIEPGRYYAAPAASLYTRVTDVKNTQANEKGAGARFAMVDAGFVDLVRPAMYGSYHRIEVVEADAPERATEEVVVAGPLCESGDIFTRDEGELLRPRVLPSPRAGDLLAIRDGGAYGYAMSSNYNSIGRAPQLWLEPDGAVHMISKRETLEDLIRAETNEPIF